MPVSNYMGYFGEVPSVAINPTALRNAKLYTILAFLSAVGLCVIMLVLNKRLTNVDDTVENAVLVIHGKQLRACQYGHLI